jgi:hypothetical protein
LSTNLEKYSFLSSLNSKLLNIFLILSSLNLFLFHHLTNSAEASINNVLLSFLDFFKTIIQVPIVVQKNKSTGN